MFGDRWITAIIVAVLLFAAASPAGACQEGQKGPDDWEAYHNSYQPPDSVMDAIGVRPGMVVAEVGAGRGRYVVHMARRVGPEGRIYANDIDKNALLYLGFRCMRDSITNVETVLGEVTDPKLPAGSCDLIYVINTYHHFDEPVELMKKILPALKEGGTFVVIEHDPVKYPDAGSHSTPRRILIDQAEEAGFELVRIETFLERDNINIFRAAVRIEELHE
jgi:ubiquinone/menaquinone biosynthesis C-methylase UbiE